MRDFEKLDAALRLIEDEKSVSENLKSTMKIMIDRIKEWTAEYCEFPSSANLYSTFGYIAAYNQFLIFTVIENCKLVGLLELTISNGFTMIQGRAKEVKEDA